MPANRAKSAAADLKLFLERHLGPDQYEEADKLVDAIVAEAANAPDRDDTRGTRDNTPTYAMDSANPGRIVADRDCAIREVEPIVGRAAVLACDSAASVFRVALAEMGVSSARTVHASALPSMFRMASHRGVNGQPLPQPIDARAMRATAHNVGRIRII